MFANTLQPSVLSIFSSASSHPTILASRLRSSTTFPADSFISLVRDATDEEEQVLAWHGAQGSARDMKGKGKEVERGNLRSRVLHLQAPDIKTTSIRLGAPTAQAEGLGVSLPFLHLAVKDLGQLFFFDVCVRDERGRLVMIRASTWQTKPKVYPNTVNHLPMLHLPLVFPPQSPHQLTPWTTVTLPLHQLLSSFPSLGGPHFARFSSLQSIEIHANCRLRRIWCTEDGSEVVEGMALRGMMAELALFEAEEEQT